MTPSQTLVLKFGSSVLRSRDDLPRVVHEIYRELRGGARVLAVVSAYEGRTDRLFARGRRIAHEPAALATLVATGELVSAAELALALDRSGVAAAVLEPGACGLGAEGPALDALPSDIDAGAIELAFERHDVLVVPGFFGRARTGHWALFGRGGSDLTALFLAARLTGARARLLKDVDGVYDADPALSPRARRFATLTFDDARAHARQIVQEKALCFAREHGVGFDVAALGSSAGTSVGADATVLAPRLAPAPVQRVALLGLGTVGSGVFRELVRNRAAFRVRRVLVRSTRSTKRRVAAPALLTDDLGPATLTDCDIVVELLGGEEPARTLITQALERGIDVVTANKLVVARHCEALQRIAESSGARLRYAAAVGGAAPMLERLAHLREREPIESIEGVLNATTNFVLDRMADGRSRDEAVAETHALGFCEADPALDLGGADAADKLELAARAAFGAHLPRVWCERRGIEHLGADAVRGAQDEGARWRLVARAELRRDHVLLSVAPRRVPLDHALADVRAEHNALLVELRGGHTLAVRGKGAGCFPTTEAVLGDLLELSREARACRGAERRAAAAV